MLTSSSSAPPPPATTLDRTNSSSSSNGQILMMDASALTNEDAPYDSTSDLSEVVNPPLDATSPATSSNHQSEFGAQDTDNTESSAAEAQDESDDADFDMVDSPPEPAPTTAREERSTSTESRRPAKRKQPAEDEHILANPELYGLRRSVCYHGAVPRRKLN